MGLILGGMKLDANVEGFPPKKNLIMRYLGWYYIDPYVIT